MKTNFLIFTDSIVIIYRYSSFKNFKKISWGVTPQPILASGPPWYKMHYRMFLRCLNHILKMFSRCIFWYILNAFCNAFCNFFLNALQNASNKHFLKYILKTSSILNVLANTFSRCFQEVFLKCFLIAFYNAFVNVL